jgi:P4 family phage/plasmid primase-like protien
MTSKIAADELDLHYSFERVLIPLDMSPGPSQYKKPLHKNWNSNPYVRAEIEKYARKGFNLGWRLGPLDLVIDVDPRNGGEDGLRRLLFDLGRDGFEEHFPTVLTGGGGRHYYGKLPAEITVSNSLAAYPGVEFKSRGRQVVIPGSMHPSGAFYTWDQRSPFEYEPPEIPADLFAWIQKRPGEPEPEVGATADEPDDSIVVDIDPDGTQITPQKLREILSKIPVEKYRDQELWFNLLASAHSATKGAGREVFVKWSTADPPYNDHAHKIRARWQSLKTKGEGLRRTGSLIRELRRYVAVRFVGPTPEDDFVGVGETVPDDIKIKRKAGRDRFTLDPEPVQIEDDEALSAILKSIQRLTPTSSSVEIVKTLKKARGLDPLDLERVMRAIRSRTGLGLTAQKGQLSLIQKNVDSRNATDDEIADLGQRVAELILSEYYPGGRLLHAMNQEFFAFDSTHWKARPENLIKQVVLAACDEIRAKAPKLKFSTAAIMYSAETVLIARCAKEADVFKWESGLPSVINTRNAELWIDPETGVATAKPHRPESYLSTCLPIDYDPRARCKLFDQTIREIFANSAHPAEMVRHFFEFFGYLIQPRKDIASYWLFHGKGANGKTCLLNIVTALLGDAVIERSIGEFDLRRSPHCFADIVGKLAIIDEDLRVGTLLPEDFLKKVSEVKHLTANPKFKTPFRFKAVCSVVMAGNSWPQTRDFSLGMRRRAQVIPFSRTFKSSEMDRSRASRIIATELPGILNKALAGLERLRARGDFDPPVDCRAAAELWIDEASQLSAFVTSTCKRSKGARVKLSELWAIYKLWTVDEGIDGRRVFGKRGFINGLLDLGFKIKKGAGNKSLVLDLLVDADHFPGGDFVGIEPEELPF